jgi:hypothetical protein
MIITLYYIIYKHALRRKNEMDAALLLFSIFQFNNNNNNIIKSI